MKRVLSIVLTLALLLGMVPGTVTAKAEATAEEVTQWTADSVQLRGINAYLEDRVDWLDIHFAYDAEFLNYQMTFRLQDDYPGGEDENGDWLYGRVPADVYETMLFSLFAVDEALLQSLRNETEYDAESNTYALTYPIGAGGFGQSCFYRGYVANDGVIEVYSEEVSFISLGTQFESWEAYDAFLLETVGYITDDLWMADDLPESIEYNGKVYNLGYQEDNAGYFYEVNTGHGNLYRFDFANGSLRLLGEDTFAAGEMPETFADDSVGVTLSGEGVLCNALSEDSESWSVAAEAMRDMSERFAAYSIQQKLNCALPEYGWGPTYERAATFRIPLPGDFTGNVDAYLLNAQGGLEALEIVVDSENRIAEVVTNEWGTLILADQDAAVVPEPGPEPGGDGPVVEDGPVWVGSCGENVTWELMGDGTLYIFGSGAMYSYNLDDITPWWEYRTDIKTAVIQSGVTNIGDAAFAYCSRLNSVTIPDSVTNIGFEAFYACSSLTEVTLPANVTNIDGYAFSYCSSLTGVKIPANVISIGDGAFEACESLEKIEVDFENQYYSNDASGVLFNKLQTELLRAPGMLSGEYAIPDSVTSIAVSAFSYCGSLVDVMIPDSVTSIGRYAFSYCSGLVSITIPNSVTAIQSGAIHDCSSLAVVTLPNSVTSIAWGAFDNCDNLWHVLYTGTEEEWALITIGNSNESLINATRHYNCTGDEIRDLENQKCDICDPISILAEGTCGEDLTWVLTEDGVLTISGEGEMYGYDWVSDLAPWYDYRERISAVIIDDGVTSIGRDAFYNCVSLEAISIPNSICYIGDYAFSSCTSLRSIVIPASVESVGLGAFDYCALDRAYIRSEQVASQLLSNDDAFIWQNTQYLCFDNSMSYDAEYYGRERPCVTAEICDGVTYTVYGWHVMGELVSQVEATCTEDGYAIYRCAVCAQEYVQDVITAEHTRGERVFENEISDETGYVMEWDFAYYCTVCGLELERTHMLAPAANGRDIWFYYPGGDLYITGTADGTRLLGSNLSADAAIFTAWRTEDGVYTFVYDGKYLTSGASGNQLYLADEESECSRWVFEWTEGGWLLRNLGAFYGTKPQYLEYYNGFTTYGLGNNRTPFIFQFGYAEDLPESTEPTDQVTIAFDANGGEGVPESITASIGDTVVLPSFVPERFGYTFLGWSEDPNAESAPYWPGSDNLGVAGDVTLYAVWEEAWAFDSPYGGGISRTMDFAGQKHYYSFTTEWSGNYYLQTLGDADTWCTLYNQNGEEVITLNAEMGKFVYLEDGQTYLIQVGKTGEGIGVIGVDLFFDPPTDGGEDFIIGDLDDNGVVDTDDAIYLLYYTLFGDELYPVWCNCDLNSDGVEDTDDAIYLLYHTLFGEELYPLYP